ncbi:unnamed protein product, partial [Rotaria socialis]
MEPLQAQEAQSASQ